MLSVDRGAVQEPSRVGLWLTMVKELARIVAIKLDGFALLAKPEYGEEFKEIYRACRKYTITSVERMYALYLATRYVAQANIPGDLVECGVFKGGSAMIMALALKNLNDTKRKIYLYDTYSGMTEPTDKDRTFYDRPARGKWKRLQNGESNRWCYSDLDAVRDHVFSTGYPDSQFVFVQGKVEETIPGSVPERISLLRLDTDWFESTYHELRHLYPRLSNCGVLLVDDYGHWRGAQEATDRYFKEHGICMLLHRIDYTGRIGIKVEGREGVTGW